MVKADHQVLIIGAGVSGINMGIQLGRQLGEHDYIIVEKGAKLGGTWFFNTYPGAGCDVPSHFYSFSFAPNPDWTHQFSYQQEIADYVTDVAHKYNVPQHCLFSTECMGSKWDEQAKLWRVSLKDLETGKVSEKTAKTLISAVGVLGIPADCPLPGKEQFKGEIWHSAQWNHKVPYAGKNVVVVGNGCSATQFVPIVLEKAKSVHQFIRGSHYYMERPNPEYSAVWKWAFCYVPGFNWAYRFLIYAILDYGFNIFRLSKQKEREALEQDTFKYIKKTAPEKYHDLLLPKFALGQKRRVFDTDYLTALYRDNMSLSDTPLKRIVPNGVETETGEIVEADIIILANGFKTQDFLVPMEIIGDGGISLEKRWKDQNGARAYLGAAIPGFPNFAMLIGPNTVQGHFSVIYTSECAVNYAIKMLKPALKEGKIVRVKDEAETRYNQWIQSELKHLVWAQGGEKGWYIDKKSGHNPTIYPAEQTRFWWQTMWPVWRDFEVSLT